jgi:hypothetical protein
LARVKNYRKIGKRGYRLHDERIAYSGGEGSMRSIKYELAGKDKQSVIDAVIHDNKCLYGDLNFNDYLDDGKTANFLDFWIGALKLGFYFSKQSHAVADFNESLLDDLFEKIEIKDELDKKKWIEWVNKSSPKSDDKNGLIKNVLKLAKDQKVEPSNNLKKIASKFADNKQDRYGAFSLVRPDSSNFPKYDNKDVSWNCDTNFIETENDRTKALDRIIEYHGKSAKKLGLDANDGAMSLILGNFFSFVSSRNYDQYLAQVKDYFDYDVGEIKKRLDKLYEIACNIPKEPKLVDGWSKYNVDFGKTIRSWYSNRDRNRNDALNQFFGKEEIDRETGEIKTETVGIGIFLNKLQKIDGIDVEIKEGVLQEVIDHIAGLDNSPNKLDRDFTDALNNHYLPTLRDELNDWVQKDKANARMLPKKWFKILKKKTQKMPLFFGENKLALWEQLKNLKSLVYEEIDKLEEVLSDNFKDYKIENKQIDMLAQLYNRIKIDGNEEVILVLENIEKELEVNFSDRTDRATFNLTGFERGKYKELKIPNRIMISRLQELSQCSELYKKIKSAPQNDFNLRDITQLSKIVTAAIVRGSNKEREVNLIHANLSGYANLISKGEFISRYPVQAVNGMQNLLAHNGNGHYFYKFNDKKFVNIEKQEVIFANQGNNFTATDEKFWTKTTQNVPVLAVRSSRYQIQFLDWFFGKHSKKKSWLSAGGSFTIAEKNCRIDWSGEEPKIIDQQNDRLFVSQPFTINPPSKRLVDSEKIRNRYIGVDIGEYGLAWSLVEVNGDRVEQIESGFIFDNQQLTLKKDVKDLREKQVYATFTSPDTKIARVRESLIGSYRNLLEDMAMQKNARLSFEYEVSNFETGSNKISKVYDSIKRGSVVKKDNNIDNKQAWGNLKNDEFIWKAFETTAAGTSQFCTKCKRWSSLSVSDSVEYKLEEYEEGLFKIKINDGKYVRVFAPKNHADDSIKGEDGLKNMIYKAMRPNMDGVGIQVVERKFGPEKFAKLQKNFGPGTKRGNIAIYVCPYIECQHIADADLQAAFNIAVRGYLKYANPDRAKNNREEGLSTKFLCEAEMLLSFNPVEF